MMTNDSVVVSSRVRLARNFKGIPFPQRLDDKDAVRLIINKAEKAATFKHDTLLMSDVNSVERKSLVERHLISPDLIKHVDTGALILSKDESISVMINEEDHIRAQCIKAGLNLLECYRVIDAYDNALSKEMPIAYDSEFGYLTACLTNVGTGMRASAMLFLPAMSFTETIDKYVKYAAKEGMTVRGVYGERSKPEGCLYQVSNARSIGLTEQNIIDGVERVVERLSAVELGLRNELYHQNEMYFKDKVYRAYGVLTNARVLPSSEFMEIMALLKFGIAMNIIQFKNMELLNKVVLTAQPANLCLMAGGKELSPDERDVVRARYVREQLSSLK